MTAPAQAFEQLSAELDRRSAAIGDGTVRDPQGTGGWDAYEVVGNDGLLTNEQGAVSLVSGRGIVPWHKLGTVVDHAMTAQEALELGGLDYTVELRPLFVGADIESKMGTDRTDRGWMAVRTDTGAHKGLVGNTYTIINNRDSFAFLTELVGLTQGDAIFDTAGELASGTTFMSLRLPESITLDAEGAADVIEPYIMSTNRFDGTAAFRVVTTPFRPVCGNTVRWGAQHAMSSWTVHHRANAMSRLAEARRTLKLSSRYFTEFAKEAGAMLQTPMTAQQFDDFLAWVMPIDDDAKSLARRRNDERRDAVRNLYDNAKTQENIRGTVWAAEQAYVEWNDHNRGVRASKTLTEDVARASRIVASSDDEKKSQAHARLLLLTDR